MTKQVLSIEQMQLLQELGIDITNASVCWYKPDYDTEYFEMFGILNKKELTSGEDCIPAYTLQDVLDAMTRWEINDGFCPRITIDLSERLIRYHYKDKDRVSMVMKSFDSTGCLIDAAYELLCWAIEKKFIETKKNE